MSGDGEEEEGCAKELEVKEIWNCGSFSGRVPDQCPGTRRSAEMDRALV